MIKMKIKKGDTVIVLSGKDKGKKGKIVQSFPAEGKVLVEGVNVKKVHERSKQRGKKGSIVDRALPVYASSVGLIDPKDGKATRVRIVKDGGKVKRISTRSGQAI